MRRIETSSAMQGYGKNYLETAVEFLLRLRRPGALPAGSLAPAQTGHNGSLFHRR
jgi:hypothetical protein